MDPLEQENEEGQVQSDSSTDTDVNEESSTPTDSNEESSTSEQETETAEDAISDALGLTDDAEGKADSDTDGDDAAADKDETKDGEGKDAKPDEDANKDDKTDKDDELYKEPEGLKEQASKRFQDLVSSHKEVSAQVMERDETIGEFRQMIDESGASPEEFNDLLRYSQMATSGDLEGALALLDGQRELLAQAMGKPLPGVDLLSDFPDLREKVDSFAITEDAALEMATSRRNTAKAEKQRTVQSEQQDQSEANQLQTDDAVTSITKLSNDWKANDIDYLAKHDRLMKRAAEIASKYPPREWAPMLEDYYNVLTEVNASTNTTRKSTNQPLRPGGGSGGSKEPGSSADAISQALGLGD